MRRVARLRRLRRAMAGHRLLAGESLISRPNSGALTGMQRRAGLVRRRVFLCLLRFALRVCAPAAERVHVRA